MANLHHHIGYLNGHQTYIHNWPLQPFSQDYGLGSHTTHVVCVNFMREWRDLQFNVDSERQIFEKLFHGNFIYSQSFCQKSGERKSPRNKSLVALNVCQVALSSWNQSLFTSIPWSSATMDSVIMVQLLSPLTLMVTQSSFSEITLLLKPHQTVTRNVCIGFCKTLYGFSEPQIRQFCLLTYLPRWKWASSEKVFFFFKIVIVTRSLVQ